MAVAEAERGLAIERDGADEARVLEWVSHPIRHQPEKTALLVGVVALAAAGVYATMGSVYWAAAAVVFLALGVYDYWLPTTFRLDERGVSSRTLFFARKKRWDEVRSLHPDARGVLVSPFPAVTRLDTFRGLYVRFDGNREAVLAVLRAPRPGGSP